ncbi:6-O-methylguanine DNA methyltransferase [Aliifodinibius salipaludis]|uniref:6-O-methylguanine DNA methyltransferase n=1 Tax=Fodinibius salipaludis TaxID=2032627 RepID=A0A2A2GF15_9BACT|nr:MGMT family protein [Aliifodinibius salipaludis]PAU95517.1 6-O-methylguanine DNA methyltransferase [Aliifodinibius salipaludis]
MEDYYQRVYKIVEQIPKGKVTTYGSIARYLGIASGARMVGYALNKAAETNIPAHRVVNRNGELTGRAYFPDDTMRERLKQENIRFIDEYQVDIDQHLWDPNEEMG